MSVSCSVVIISLNEGESLRRTVDNMLATLPPASEVIVVDDGSSDGSADFLDSSYPVTLLRPSERLGVSGARNYGAGHARGRILVFSDAHVIAPDGWYETLAELLTRPEIGAVAPAVSMMQPGGSIGYGQKWRDAGLGVEWLGCRGVEPYAVPLLCGCFLALRREVFLSIGGFDPGMILWGAEDCELSIHLWSLGYECWVAPQVVIQHAFRAQFPYQVKWAPVLHNRLRLASVHFGARRLARVLDRLKPYNEFAEAAARLLVGDIGDRCSRIRAVRQRHDDSFFQRFALELRSDLAPASPARVTAQAVPPASVTACLVSWKRPQNLPHIVQSLRRSECIDDILIWNNDPSIPLDIPDSRTRIIPSSQNLSCYGRFACAAQARHSVIYVQDDDAINRDVDGLYRQFLDNPTGVAHALAPTHWPERNRYTYGDARAALIGWGAFFRKEWLSVLDDLPESTRRDPLFQREADKYFTLLLQREHTPVAGDIAHLDGHSTPGVALWLDARRHQHASLAIRDSLRWLRLKTGVSRPAPWNVVITCHNYGRYLGDAIESVLANDADYEIHIVDDASTDETPELAAIYARQYPHIHLLQNEGKRGPGHSRNRGIGALDSEFVVLLDADDRLGHNYLYSAARKLSNGADVVNPDAVLFGIKQERWNVPDATTLEMLLARNSVHCSSAFRRSLWKQVGGIDEQMPCWMDYEFWIRLAAAGARIQGLHGDHFFYRTHAGSLSESASRIETDLRRYLREKHAKLYAAAVG
jgi:glycosyltransferase involved in cell wall biosynthesis